MSEKIGCLECDYVGAPAIDGEEGDEDAIYYCPECDSMYIAIVTELEQEN